MARTPTTIERRLVPPRPRPGMVDRTRLLDNLRRHRSTPVIAIAAPPGYGKSTLLAQWVAGDDRPSAWLTLDEQDNDPAVLLRQLAASVSRISPLPPGLSASLGRTARIHDSVLPRFRAAFASIREPFVLVVDDVQFVRDSSGADVLTALAEDVPDGSQVAFASRDLPPIPLGRLRARGRLREFGTDDLALDLRETGALLREVGVPLLPADLAALHGRTEGWPAGLYLAALSIQASGSTAAVHVTVTGADRFVTDYLRSELLARLDPDDVTFLRRTAVLGEMSGPLIDHVLETRGSAARLHALERSNLFVVPLDRTREWYRYHTLFRELLVAELRDQDPDGIPGTLARAADWYFTQDATERAIALAFEADDLDRAARMVTEVAMEEYWQGRYVLVHGWVRRFDRHIARYPEVAAIGARLAALAGDGTTAERLLATGMAAERLRSVALTTRAVMLTEGLRNAREAAERAIAIAPPGSRLRAEAMTALVSVLKGLGEDDAAGLLLAELEAMPADAVTPPGQCLVLAYLARRAMDEGDWASAEAYARRAHAIVVGYGLEDYSDAGPVAAVGARIALHHGDRRRALEELMTAQRLRVVMTAATPFASVWARIEMGRTFLGLGDTPGARTMIAEADAIIRIRPDLGALLARLEDLRLRTAAAPAGRRGASTLTPAELRLLPYLPTHLSYAEIAQRFELSSNTIKTQAASIYAKLDVASRAQAVERARAIGLLEP